MSLVDKIRKARERGVEVGGFTFTVRRPTDLEMLALRGAPITALLAHVVGWSNVREIDVLASGDAAPLAFDPAVAAEWLADRPDLLEPIAKAIMTAYADHVTALGEVEKN
jgi:hypothetical protein